MRYLWIILPAVLFSTACKNATNEASGTNAAKVLADSSQYTSIQWLDSTSRDFGKIQEGQKLEISYRFKNTGDKPLVILSVHPSCGCTVADQPDAPIAPGAEGQIRAVFNSEGHPGVANKGLTVTANTKGNQTYILKFSAEVQKKS